MQEISIFSKRKTFTRPAALILFFAPLFGAINRYLIVAPVLLSVLLVFLSIWSVKINLLLNYKRESLKNLKNENNKAIKRDLSNNPQELFNSTQQMFIFFDEQIIEIENHKNLAIFTHNHRKWIIENNQIRKCKANVHRNIDEYRNLEGFDQEITQKNCLKIEIPTWSQLIYEHFTAPFFVFQIFCGILWCLDEYIYHSLFTLFMLFVFEIGVVFSRRVTMKHYRSMEQKEVEVKKILFQKENFKSQEGFKTIEMSSTDLIPGDVLILDSLIKIPADFVLLKGACAINEAMLTGESLPNYKEDISEFEGLFERQKKHVLFSGTEIVKIEPTKKLKKNTDKKYDLYEYPENCIVVMVIETGFNTQQGKLIRKMMTSSPPDNTEAYLFLLFLLVFAIISSCIVLYQSLKMEKSNYKILLEIVLILTNVVPPELPLELTIAVNAAVQKLLTLGVFCLEPFRIVDAGKVTVACFDKTGTLTESEMQLAKIVTKNENAMKQVALTCHSLIKSGNDEIIGDPLEMSAFKHYNGNLSNDNLILDENSKFKILKRFHFSSNLRRMSVVYKVGNETFIGMKGAPETIKKFLNSKAAKFDDYLKYAGQGFRVLAVASKKLNNFNFRMTRDQVETDNFEFNGFLLYQSKLKEESKEVIESLQSAGVNVVMITGDNSLTAISVAKSLAFFNNSYMEGDEIGQYLDIVEGISTEVTNQGRQTEKEEKVRNRLADETEIERFSDLESEDALNDQKIGKISVNKAVKTLKKVTVFARADPKHKERLIRFYKNQKGVALMCGDGTNDVGALNEADVGIALLTNKEQVKKAPESFAEAMRNEMLEGSINLGDACVAAPFTIRNNLLTGVLNVVRQGRSTLVTTFQMYKILALNSLITAYSLSFLDSCGVRFSDAQVTISGILLAFAFMFLTKCEPLQKISKQKPVTNIFNWYFITSILLQTLVHLVTTAVLVYYVGKPEIYVEKFTPSLLNSSLYILNTAQQISTFMINYIGRPFREDFLENAPLRNSLFACSAFILSVLLELSPELNEYIEIVDLSSVKRVLLVLLITDWLACYVCEKLCKKMFLKKLKNKKNKIE